MQIIISAAFVEISAAAERGIAAAAASPLPLRLLLLLLLLLHHHLFGFGDFLLFNVFLQHAHVREITPIFYRVGDVFVVTVKRVIEREEAKLLFAGLFHFQHEFHLSALFGDEGRGSFQNGVFSHAERHLIEVGEGEEGKKVEEKIILS